MRQLVATVDTIVEAAAFAATLADGASSPRCMVYRPRSRALPRSATGGVRLKRESAGYGNRAVGRNRSVTSLSGGSGWHPTLRHRGLVAWPGWGGADSLAALDTRHIGTIAKSLVEVDGDPLVVRRARAAGYGVLLDGEAWRNQLPADHVRRSPRFLDLAYATDASLDLKARRLPGRLVEQISVAYLDEQYRKQATLLVTPAHWVENEGGIERANDLAFAQAALAYFSDAGLDEVDDAWTGPTPQIYAGIMVNMDRLTEDAVEALVATYADVSADGYSISAVNFNESGVRTRLVLSLGLQLQQETGRPCVLSGLCSTHLAGLAVGLAATCTGRYRSSIKFPPHEFPRPKPGEEPRGRGVFVYHPAVLGACPLGDKGEKARAMLFGEHGCTCGVHDEDAAPKTQSEKLQHNLFWLMAESARAASGHYDEAIDDLEGRIPGASAERHRVGMGRLRPSFGAAVRLSREMSDRGVDQRAEGF